MVDELRATDPSALAQELRELRRANEELRALNYRVSHDLLSPLKTMRGFIELCEEELRDGNVEVVAGYHEIMRQNVIRLATLVEDVLDLARVDVGEVERAELELGALVDEIFHKHRASVEQAAIRISHDCAGLRLYAERARVRQVLEHLVSNAIKYHHPDRQERCVSVTARAYTEGGTEGGADGGTDGGVVLVVRDNGIGFDASQSSAIFDSFRRATSKYPGSGLGLYIVKQHLERLGGSVRVVSSRDDTIFEVTIPSAQRP